MTSESAILAVNLPHSHAFTKPIFQQFRKTLKINHDRKKSHYHL